MTHDEIIAVIAAHREGKSLQVQARNTRQWLDCLQEATLEDILSDAVGGEKFRVKPEPRRLFVPLAHSGGLVKRHYGTLAALRAEWPNGEYAEFVEVVQ